jgi:selenocysteine lyase/cysteine desulfurase
MLDVSPFSEFLVELCRSEPLVSVRDGLIGKGVSIPGPFGPRQLIYADHIASGRAIQQVETFIMERVLPFYGNSHTKASFCGEFVTSLREEARANIARLCGADDSFATIFAGSGATAGLNRLPHLLGVVEAARSGPKPHVFIGPYEHHSNILPWRESGAEVIEIPESSHGGPDLENLDLALHAAGPNCQKIGAFSITSNVSGIVTDADEVTAVLKKHNALSTWDYAGGGPYLPIDMRAGTPFEKDSVAISTHKFIGGPGASGILIVRKDAVRCKRPFITGGGTVLFVSSSRHDYLDDLVSREEGGTPNILGDIRAALCFLIKDAIGESDIKRRHAALRKRAVARWCRNPDIVLLGNPEARYVLPFFAFRLRNRREGGFLHPLLVTRMLSDLHGIQARGGCACAGPYGHRLLNICPDESLCLRDAIIERGEIAKPGWSRLNLSALLNDEKADLIIDAVDSLPRDAETLSQNYVFDVKASRFRHVCL